jgi:hypothetical protein
MEIAMVEYFGVISFFIGLIMGAAIFAAGVWMGSL